MTLKDQTIVIIGGTSGIGFGVAELALMEGAKVIVASGNKDKVSSAVSRLAGAVEGATLDLRSEQAIESFFQGLGAFDHLVYTAGDALSMEDLSVVNLAEARAQFDVRYWGALAAAKYAKPSIRSGGSIVFSSGMASRKPRRGWSVTSSICGAMESLTRALAVEYAPLRVNIVCPGLVQTELWREMGDDGRRAMFDRASSILPVGHPGQVQELAEVYVYLLKAGFTTGTVAVADGGASLI